MPLPARYWRLVQTDVKMVNAPELSLRGGRRPTWRPEREARGSALGVQSREGSHDFAGSALLSTQVLRDCHVASLLAMTRQGSMALGTVHCTELAVLLPLRGRAWLSPTLQLQAFPSKPAKKIGSRLRPRPGSGCLFKKGRKKRESIGKLILQRSAAEAPREAVAAALLLLLALILLLALLRIA